MPNLTPLQLAQLLQSAGFRGAALEEMVAIGLRESGGNPRAYNGKPPDNSYGLFQINMIGALGPDRRARFGLQSNEELFDPATNARVAFGLSSSGTNLSPWKGPAPSPEYKRQAAEAVAQLGGVPSGAPSSYTAGGESWIDRLNPLDDAADALGSVSNFAGALTEWVTWRRVLLVLGGILLVIIAASILVADVGVATVT